MKTRSSSACSFNYRANLARLLVVAGLFVASTAIVRADGTIEQPIPLKQVAPNTPGNQKRSGNAGVVTLRFWVDAKGAVSKPEVVDTTDWGFARPALDAIAQWTFKAAQRDGVAVGTWVTMPFKFTFADDKVAEPAVVAAK